MKITKQQLKQIIKEELEKVVEEGLRLSFGFGKKEPEPKQEPKPEPKHLTCKEHDNEVLKVLPSDWQKGYTPGDPMEMQSITSAIIGREKAKCAGAKGARNAHPVLDSKELDLWHTTAWKELEKYRY